MNSKQFLETVYANKPEDSWIHIFHGQNKRCYFYKTVGEVKEHLTKHPNDTYIAPCFRKEYLGPYKRGATSDISGITAFYCDIDIAHDVHSKKNLPPTVEDALALVKGRGLDPSIIVHTGHGLQAWWVLKEPWMFDSDSERDEALKLSRKLNQWFGLNSQEKGWEWDNTSDLTRVLRPPGTFNCKNGKKVPTSVLEHNEYRYNPPEIEEFLQDIEISPPSSISTGEITQKIGSLVLDRHADFPLEKSIQLQEIYGPQFMGSFTRTRSDQNDTSNSGYDMSMALMGARVDFSDQDIANLIISSRRQKGVPLKLENPQYFARTILTAREWVAQEQVESDLPEVSQKVGTPYEESGDVDRLKKLLSKQLGLKIVRVVKFLGDPPQYQLVLDVNGAEKIAHFENVAKITSRKSFLDTITDSSGRRPPLKANRKDGLFDKFIDNLMQIKVEEYVSEEAFLKGQIESWIYRYLDKAEKLDIEEAYPGRKPFFRDGRWYFYAADFRSWVKQLDEDPPTKRRLEAAFKEYGWECPKRHCGGKVRHSVRAWRLPAKFC